MAQSKALNGALAAVALALAVLMIHDGLNPDVDDAPAGDARRIIGRDPLNVAALRALGLAFDRAGETSRADRLLSFAGRRSWRDGPTHAWLFAQCLKNGQFGEALTHADALLRHDGDGRLAARLMPMLIATTRDDAALRALASRLALAPPWRAAFLNRLARDGAPEANEAIFRVLKAGATPPTPQEVAPYINRLVDLGDDRGAFETWEALDGGDPSGRSDGTPFTWSDTQGVGASSQIASPSGATAVSALRVNYDGYGLPTLPRRLLILPAGRRRLTWRQWIQADGTVAHMVWAVRCAGDGQLLAQAADPVSAAGWQAMSLIFDVPARGCAGQWLELIPKPADRRDPTVAWYDFTAPRRP